MEKIEDTSLYSNLINNTLIDIFSKFKASTSRKKEVRLSEKLKILMDKMNEIKQKIYNVVDPDYQYGPWTHREHESFIKSYLLYGKDWKKIQYMIQTRTITQIRSHCHKCLHKYEFIPDTNHEVN